jgi:outer membrane lipoprotein-sorting protein
MTDEERRENSIRLKLVEEAVIEFRVIAETVVISHAKKLDEHDRAIKDIERSIYQTCDAKAQEVDTKISRSEDMLLEAVEASEDRLITMVDKHFSYAVWAFSGVLGILGALSTLAMMWVSYDNTQLSSLSDKIGVGESVSVKNRENILSTQDDVGHLRDEIKDVKSDIHEILDRMIK